MVSLVVEMDNCSWPMLPLLIRLFPTQAGFGCAYQDGGITGSMGSRAHVLVNLGDALEAGYVVESCIENAVAYELVVGVGLLVIGAVRALQPFLARPVVA